MKFKLVESFDAPIEENKLDEVILREDMNDGTVFLTSDIVSGIDGSHIECVVENAVPGTCSFVGQYLDGDSAGTKYTYVYNDAAGKEFISRNGFDELGPTEILTVDGEDKGAYYIFTEDEIKNLNTTINESVSTVDIMLTDADIVAMDEKTGDIMIEDTVTEYIPGLPVVIKFEEDVDETVHKFIMKDHNTEDGYILLKYEGMDQLIESLLMEANPFKAIKNAIANNKADRATKKALDMDKTNAAKEWTYIINGKSMNHAEAMKHSDEERANAIVLDKGFYIRRGTEDLSNRLIRYTKDNAEVTSTYSNRADRKAAAKDERDRKVKEKADEKQSRAEEKAAKKEKDNELKHLDSFNLRDWAFTAEDGGAVSFGDYIAMNDTKKAKVKAVNRKGEVMDPELLAQVTQRYLDKRDQKETDRLAKQKAADEKKQAKADEKQARADEKAAKKTEDEIARQETNKNKNTFKQVKKTLSSDASRRTMIKPKGTITFYPASKADRNTADTTGKSISAKQYAKLPTEEKRKYIGVDSKGSEFSYQQLLNFQRKAKKLKMESLEENYGDLDFDYDLLEELFTEEELEDADYEILEEDVHTLSGDEVMAGWIDNVPDDLIDEEVENLEEIASKLGIDRMADLAVLVDDDMFYDPSQYHFNEVEKTRHGARRYQIEGVDFFVCRSDRGGYYLYFTSPEDAARYAKIVEDENETNW